jgi:hypothetical protein
MTRKEKIVSHSFMLAKQIGLTLVDKEFNYGKGIGRADNYCIKSNWIVIFELEFSQRHPEMNVLKVWPFLKNNQEKKIFFIHHIADTKQVSPNRIELSNFISEKISENTNNRFEYFQILNDFSEQKLLILQDKLKLKQIL